MIRIMATDGDRVDLICWRHYGNLNGRIVEQVLEENPGLSIGTELSAGTVVSMPEITPQELERTLW